MIVICAWCKSELSKTPGDEISHGMCKPCAEKMMSEEPVMTILATAMHLSENLWRVSVLDKHKDVEGSVLVLDVARELGATHLSWRDILNHRGEACRNPFPLAIEIT